MARATWTEPDKLAGAHESFGGRVRLLRSRRRLTQRWLADEVGRSVAYLSDLETGKRMASADTLARLADVLGVTMDELWRGVGRCDPAELAAN
jgi:transcriptional regulator with XRE-family HTH domain